MDPTHRCYIKGATRTLELKVIVADLRAKRSKGRAGEAEGSRRDVEYDALLMYFKSNKVKLV